MYYHSLELQKIVNSKNNSLKNLIFNQDDLYKKFKSSWFFWLNNYIESYRKTKKIIKVMNLIKIKRKEQSFFKMTVLVIILFSAVYHFDAWYLTALKFIFRPDGVGIITIVSISILITIGIIKEIDKWQKNTRICIRTRVFLFRFFI